MACYKPSHPKMISEGVLAPHPTSSSARWVTRCQQHKAPRRRRAHQLAGVDHGLRQVVADLLVQDLGQVGLGLGIGDVLLSTGDGIGADVTDAVAQQQLVGQGCLALLGDESVGRCAAGAGRWGVKGRTRSPRVCWSRCYARVWRWQATMQQVQPGSGCSAIAAPSESWRKQANSPAVASAASRMTSLVAPMTPVCTAAEGPWCYRI